MLEFIEDTHTYILDGEIIPSVSEILHFIFPSKYDGVPLSVLNNKATYGSKVHESIEMYELNNNAMSKDEAYYTTSQALDLDYIQQASLMQWVKLKARNNIEVIAQEQMINYENCYAGRFDMVARINDEECLCDIKTTAELDIEYLSWQLSFYNLAMNNQYKKLYAIWLPKKGLGKLIEIEPKPTEELLEILNQFKRSKEKENEFIW